MAVVLTMAVVLALAPQRRVLDAAPQSPFAAGPHASHHSTDANFRAWPALNDVATRHAVNAGRRHRLHLGANNGGADPTLDLFSGGTLMDRFALALAARKAVDRKVVLLRRAAVPQLSPQQFRPLPPFVLGIL